VSTVVVAGMLAGDPGQGGATWATLQWALGIEELGHQVTVVDDLPPGRSVNADVLATLDAVRSQFNVDAAVAAGGEVFGMDAVEFGRRLNSADAVVNLSGRFRHLDAVRSDAARVFVDLDPGFIQFWHAQGHDFAFGDHTHHYSVGQAIGTDACAAPTCGVEWGHVLPPVVLRHWPRQSPPPTRKLTTVANWRSYGSVHHLGRFYGQKVHSVRPLLELGRRSGVPVELAADFHDGDHSDHAALVENLWEVVPASAATGTADDYQRYVQGSWAEIGIAKHGYVAAATGWVSDRSAAYLASGRPVIAQDTGPTPLHGQDGFLSFSDVDTACAAIEELCGEYQRHADGARHLAEELFASDVVLGKLLEEVGL
jgi:hypothetical protein